MKPNKMYGGGSVWRGILAGIFVFLQLMGTFSGHPPQKIRIITSIFPFYEFARSVSGEKAEVQILLPPGAEAHTWKPRPSDIFKLNEADLFIGVGSALEPWLDEVLESLDNPRLKILEADSIVSLRAHEKEERQEHGRTHEGHDPHLWLDFSLDIQIVERIRSALAEIDPASADFFARNAENCIQRLKNLDRKYRDTLESCSTRTLIVGGHSAFGYLAERYGLNQIAVYGISPDAQPSPRQVIDIIRTARENNVRTVFYETAVSGDVARMIAKEIGGNVLSLNPGVSLTKEEREAGIDFFTLMERNLENLKNGLSCKKI